MPLQFLQCLVLAFFASLMVSPRLQLFWIFSYCHIFFINSHIFSVADYAMSAFSTSVVIESIPGTFPFCNPFIAVLTSPSVCLYLINCVMDVTVLPWSTMFHDSSLIHGLLLKLFLQPQCTPYPSLGSHALFLHLALLLAFILKHLARYLLLRFMLNIFEIFLFFSSVVSYLTLIPFFSFGWFLNLNLTVWHTR